MKLEFWEFQPVVRDTNYIPDDQEIAEMQEVEKMQQECKHLNFSEEDGCSDCGFYNK